MKIRKWKPCYFAYSLSKSFFTTFFRGRALDCRAGGRGFDSRDRTNTQGLKNDWELKVRAKQGERGILRKVRNGSESRDEKRGKIIPSSRLASPTRFSLRAKCRVHLAWLIKRLLCRLAWLLFPNTYCRASVHCSGLKKWIIKYRIVFLPPFFVAIGPRS